MKVITEDEAALYDRQIRLWGVEAQRRLLASRILLINMQGVGAEIAKNLVLSGINSLTLLDSNVVTEADLKTNFLISQSSIGKNRAEACVDALQTLNPLVKVIADPGRLEDKDESYYNSERFSLVCALTNDLHQLEHINRYCRKNNVMFLSSFVYGLYGYMFVDYNEYHFIAESAKVAEEVVEKKKSNAACSTEEKQEEKLMLEEKTLKFKSFEHFLKDYSSQLETLSAIKMKRLSKAYFVNLLFNTFYQTHHRAFSATNELDKQSLFEVKKSLFERLKLNDEILTDAYLADKEFGEFCPVNAIVGGVVAQEVIKAISKKNEPIDNYFIFDGNLMSGEIMRI